jgi:hypothetical protein
MIIGSAWPSMINVTFLNHQTIQISIIIFLQVCNIKEQGSTKPQPFALKLQADDAATLSCRSTGQVVNK